MSRVAMIPARMGSQRLERKNLQPLAGEPLIVHAIRKCVNSGLFDEVWVNSEHADFAPIAEAEGARFHLRPEHLGNDQATSEQFIAEFFQAHACDHLFQVHSIAPLLTGEDLTNFVRRSIEIDADVTLSVVVEQLECLHAGVPVNFTFERKTNSQDLTPVQRIVWAISAWKRAPYLKAFEAGGCATYAGSIAYVPVDRMAGHVIKTRADMNLAEALWPLMGDR